MAKTYEELLDAVLEAALNKEDSSDEEEAFEEGANSELRDIKAQAKAQKATIKEMKKMYKAGNYAGAKKAGEDVIASLDDLEKQIKSVDQSFGSAVLGDLMGWSLRIVKDLLLSLVTFGIGPIVTFCKRLLSRCLQMQKSAGDKDLDYKLFNSYAIDLVTMIDDAKRQVKMVIKKCETNMKYTGNDAATQEAVDLQYEEVMTEGVLSNPLKSHVEKLKDIKKKKPAEYDGPEDVKKFVDANYDEIEKAADLLEKEPEDLRANEVKMLAGAALTWVGWLGGLALMNFTVLGGGIVALLSGAVFTVVTIASSIITYCRTSNDRKAMDELTKIRDALKKINTDKLPTALKHKVSDLITKIGDAETEINAKIKAVKEYTEAEIDAQLEIYESAYAGDITEEDRDELLRIFNESGDTAEE